MSLFVAATPIGNKQDLTARAKEALISCDLVIGEEKREVEVLLKGIGAFPKPYELLNEHSKASDISALADMCKDKTVVLVSDCGTPGFCDPGSELVRECRKRKIPISALPGPSSLMTFLSLTGQRFSEFHFAGFLPREKDERIKKLQSLSKNHWPVIVMDTPYRLKKTLEEIKEVAPTKRLILGCDLTQSTEAILEGTAADVLKHLQHDKAEFLLMIL